MESAIFRANDGRLIVVDDEGNRTVFQGGGYDHLRVGESEPYDNIYRASQFTSGWPSGWSRKYKSW